MSGSEQLPRVDVPRAGSLVTLEHVNLNIERWSEDQATFWLAGLGMALDPRADAICSTVQESGGTMKGLKWLNVGLQQFHCPVGEPVQSAQRIPGAIGLLYPSLSELAARLEKAGIDYNERRMTLPTVPAVSTTYFKLVSPSGVVVWVHEPAEARHLQRGWLGPLLHIEQSPEIALPGTISLGLGMAYTCINVRRGTAAGIARFYRKYLGGITEEVDGHCTVAVGAEQALLFCEVPDADLKEYDGHHIALYVNDFVELYDRAAANGLVWSNPRFPHLSYDTLTDALKFNEFRIVEMRDPQGGALLHTLEHEIRSLAHPSYTCRVLINQPIYNTIAS